MADSLPSSTNVLPVCEPVPFIDLVAQYRQIKPQVQEAVRKVFDTQRFVMGEEVAQFECEVASYCDSRAAIGCASGTDALVLSLIALDIKPGDEIITTPFTFFATAGAIHRVGAIPVFVDIEPDSFNIDTEKVEAAITEKTKAIIPVHLYGQCAEMDPLWRIAVRFNLGIIEDACQAIGSTYKGRRAGVLGTIGCFSFFPTKNLGGAGDGGMITTDDPHIARKLRRLRVHGDQGGYDHVEVGFNSRLDSLQAAVLRAKMPLLESWTAARQQNAAVYEELFRKYQVRDQITVPAVLPERNHIYNQYCIRISRQQRNKVLEHLRDVQVGAAVYYPKPLHLQTCFKFLGYQEGDFPESERAAKEVLALPIFPELENRQQEIVVREIAIVLERTPKSARTPVLPPKFMQQHSTQQRVA